MWALNGSGLLVLPGVELAVGRSELAQAFHVVCVAVTERPDIGEDAGVEDVVRAVKALGGEGASGSPLLVGSHLLRPAAHGGAPGGRSVQRRLRHADRKGLL